MITEQELVDREHLTIEEAKELMNHFDLTMIDLADECGCTHSTFQIYMGDNSTKFPQKHQKTLIHYFLRQFGDAHMGKDTPSSEIKEMKNIATVKQNEDTSDEEATSTKQEEEAQDEPEQDFPKGAADLEYLVPDRIIFRPKNGLAQALQEASELSEEKRAQVHVRDGSRLISLKVESQS